MSDGTGLVEARVTTIPSCDLCREKRVVTPAEYDGKTWMGPWAYLCADHFTEYGVGLGTGRGQRLVLVESTADGGSGDG